MRTVLGVCCAAFLGCGASTWVEHGAAPADARSLAVLDGTPTFERPEVGDLGGCTGTLVSPTTVLTAAHCLGAVYDDATSADQGHYTGTFTVTAEDGVTQHRYPVVQYRMFGRALGRDDVALLRLLDRVPPQVAQPAGIASQWPDAGASMAMYGYGCIDRGDTGQGSGTKRKKTYTYGEDTAFGCPGDSGGPRLSPAGVVEVNSAHLGPAQGGRDLPAPVVPLAAELLLQVVEWSRTPCDATDAAACEAVAGCSYYDCANRCAPSGLLLSSVCREQHCLMQRTLDACHEARCGWFHCTQTCWPRGTPLDAGCEAEAATLADAAALCASGCFLDERGAVLGTSLGAVACAEAGTYAREAAASSGAASCFQCQPTGGTQAGNRPKGGWVGGRALPQCEPLIEDPGYCVNGCYLTADGRSSVRPEPGGRCAQRGAYASGQEREGDRSCWRCGAAAPGGFQTAAEVPGGGWNGGQRSAQCGP